MKGNRKTKIILNLSLCLFITSIVITYITFFWSYITIGAYNDAILPWYAFVLLISVILILPTIIFQAAYLYYYKRIQSKLPPKIQLYASFTFILAMSLSSIDFLSGDILISIVIINILFIMSFILFIITFVKCLVLKND